MDNIALNEWSHIKAEIQDCHGVFYVDSVKVLEVNGFKHGPDSRGSVGFYVDIGTDGLFQNLVVESWD